MPITKDPSSSLSLNKMHSRGKGKYKHVRYPLKLYPKLQTIWKSEVEMVSILVSNSFRLGKCAQASHR